MSNIASNPKLFVDQFNTSQTVSGLDFGDKTIGIAVSDKLHSVASPIKTIQRKGIVKDLNSLLISPLIIALSRNLFHFSQEVSGNNKHE